jgi:hypothetical protein
MAQTECLIGLGVTSKAVHTRHLLGSSNEPQAQVQDVCPTTRGL